MKNLIVIMVAEAVMISMPNLSYSGDGEWATLARC